MTAWRADDRPAQEEAPLVSVIVPTFGRADKIVRALQSIFKQTYPNLEVVVVDDNDNSSVRDETRSAIESIKTTRSVRIANTVGRIGGGEARNLGAKLARGDYLAFLDDDDIFLPNKIDSQVDFMIENKLDLSYQDVRWVTEQRKVVEHRRLNHASGYSYEELLKAHLLRPISPTAIYMIRREFFHEIGGFGDVPVGQDWILMLRAIDARGEIRYMPGVFVEQYLHQGIRISTGRQKLLGERALQEVRRKHYAVLSKSEQRHVEFRHFAVMGFASLRSKFYLSAAIFGARAVLASPKLAMIEGRTYFDGRRTARREP